MGKKYSERPAWGSVLKENNWECMDDVRGIKENQERYKCHKSIVGGLNSTKVSGNTY